MNFFCILLSAGVLLSPFSSMAESAADKGVCVTILFDNYVYDKATEAGWGFSCLVETGEQKILFDAGGDESIFLHNVAALGIKLEEIDAIVISHEHGDHIAGLHAVLDRIGAVDVHVPASFSTTFAEGVNERNSRVVRVSEPLELGKGVYLTGELGTNIKEQALLVETAKGLLLITGCAHPGIVEIIRAAKIQRDQDIYAVMGGFHLLRHADEDLKRIISDFRDLGVVKCGATHCTGDKAIQAFENAYDKDYLKMGTGRILLF